MDKSNQALIGMAVLAFSVLVAVAWYRWLQRQRIQRVEQWVKDYLSTRYGQAPQDLHIDCSDDRLWPVLVSFSGPQRGSIHRLQFDCGGALSTFSLLTEKEDKREHL